MEKNAHIAGAKTERKVNETKNGTHTGTFAERNMYIAFDVLSNYFNEVTAIQSDAFYFIKKRSLR